MSSKIQLVDRREFVKKGLVVTAVGSIGAMITRGLHAQTPPATPAPTTPAAPAGGVPAASAPPAAAAASAEIEAGKLIPDNNPLVVALKYVPDATKAELRKAARQGVEAKDQVCSNCQLYKAAGVLKGTKEEVGICQMIPGGHVKALGWCNSWVKKA